MTFPTDSKLLNKIIRFCHKVAQTENLKIRQTHVHVIKELKLVQRFRGRKNSAAKVKKELMEICVFSHPRALFLNCYNKFSCPCFCNDSWISFF